jgi:hypothetical protein
MPTNVITYNNGDAVITTDYRYFRLMRDIYATNGKTLVYRVRREIVSPAIDDEPSDDTSIDEEIESTFQGRVTQVAQGCGMGRIGGF